MPSKTLEVIIKEPKLATEFINWYKLKYKDIIITDFIKLPFEYQLGIFIIFFEEKYNYAIHADRESYVIFYPDIEKASPIISNRPGKLLDIDNIEYTDFNSSMMRVIYNYERAILKVIDLIINPF